MIAQEFQNLIDPAQSEGRSNASGVRMKTIGKSLCLLSALLAFAVAIPAMTTEASAADLSMEGSRLRVSGVLDGTSVTSFTEQLATGKVQKVVFEDATGGTAEAAQAYAAAIRTSGVQTEVRGQCHAACAYAFLAAKHHRFGSGGQINGLLIPVTSRPKPEELANRWRGEDAEKALAAFGPGSQASGSASADNALMPIPTVIDVSTTASSAPAAARNDWQPEHGVLFVSNPTLFGRVYNAFYCDGTQGRDFSRCERLSNADPYALGVLTR